MISALHNKRSLTFYGLPIRPLEITRIHGYTNGVKAAAISSVSHMTANTTAEFNKQLNGFFNSLNTERDKISQKVSEGLAHDSHYVGARGDGVKLAWSYEKVDIEMGGKGSAKWNPKQREEIRRTGKVRGAEGHHQKNVAAHPYDQGNPDNIKLYQSREEHLRKGHNGDFRNESDGCYIDKNKMLRITNRKRVFVNELRGIGIAAAIGAGIGFTIGFAVTLAQSGVMPDTLKYAVAEGGKSGMASGIQAVVSYGIGRTIGQMATCTLEGILSNCGIIVTKNISQICNMGAVGMLTIMVFSTYQFMKLVHNGMACKQALLQVSKQALFSLSLLVLSIIVQCVYGGYAGVVVSAVATTALVSYTLINTVYQRKLVENIQLYMIEKAKPLFA